MQVKDNSDLVLAFRKDSRPETRSEDRAHTTGTYNAIIRICVKYHLCKLFWLVAIVYILRKIVPFLKSTHALYLTPTHRKCDSKLPLHNCDEHNSRKTSSSERTSTALRVDPIEQISSKDCGRQHEPKGIWASTRQQGHVLADRDSKPREGGRKFTLHVEAVVRDGAVSRGGQGQGLGLEAVEGGTHLGQGDPRGTRGGLRCRRRGGGGRG